LLRSFQRDHAFRGFFPYSVFLDTGSDESHLRHPMPPVACAPSGFRTLSTLCSPHGLPSLFHPGPALGVDPSRLLASSGAVQLFSLPGPPGFLPRPCAPRSTSSPHLTEVSGVKPYSGGWYAACPAGALLARGNRCSGLGYFTRLPASVPPWASPFKASCPSHRGLIRPALPSRALSLLPQADRNAGAPGCRNVSSAEGLSRDTHGPLGIHHLVALSPFWSPCRAGFPLRRPATIAGTCAPSSWLGHRPRPE
jgi:hypothetical protein